MMRIPDNIIKEERKTEIYRCKSNNTEISVLYDSNNEVIGIEMTGRSGLYKFSKYKDSIKLSFELFDDPYGIEIFKITMIDYEETDPKKREQVHYLNDELSIINENGYDVMCSFLMKKDDYHD